MIEGTVAIVGRPNVGKSLLFNRLIEERLAIVLDTPGVTRDRIYGNLNWLNHNYRVIDTGGIQIEDAPFQKEIQAQVEIAIQEADIIIFLTDNNSGITSDDQYIASLLKRSKKPIILAVNKVDDISKINDVYEYYNLGIGKPFPISAIHGIGIGDMLDEVIKIMPCKQIENYEGMIKFSLIGRPNVGKSSLANSLLQDNRLIVSNIEGTTRDSIDTVFTFNDKKYVVIDTAGIKKRGRIYEQVDKYAFLRAKSAIERSDVCLVLLDSSTGIIDQDKHVAGLASDSRKGVIIVYNKWDLVNKDQNTMAEITKKIRKEFVYLDYAPIAFISAINGSRVNTLFPLINEVYENLNKRIKTNVLNEVVLDAQIANPPKPHNGKRLKIYYASQVSVNPIVIVLFVNDENLMHFSYLRYIENSLREAFDFTGVPIDIKVRNRE